MAYRLVCVEIVSLGHLLVFLRDTWHTGSQLVPLGLLADTHLHRVIVCLVPYVGPSGVTLRFYGASHRNYSLNVLGQSWVVVARTLVQ